MSPGILAAADRAWLAAQAEALDADSGSADAVVPTLGRSGLFGIGVPAALGGGGGSTSDAVEAIAEVAEFSLAAAFVFWGQRTFIEYLLASPNGVLRERWLQPLLAGACAGATGLSNAMKYLSGIESLQVTATAVGERLRLRGALPWVTNLRRAGFVVAAVAEREDGSAAVVALASDLPGVVRSDDLDLIALRGSNTAAIALEAVDLGPEWLLHPDAQQFCPAVRPAFLALQLGMSIGLARVALRSACDRAGEAHATVVPQAQMLAAEVERLAARLHAGLREDRFVADAPDLFRIRIRLAELVQLALQLELQATGGRAYLREGSPGFARRWREAAFIPVITPSVTQLQGELRRHGEQGL